ncbi:11113_t:CDS:2, partial [Dentiscutata erythropus]
ESNNSSLEELSSINYSRGHSHGHSRPRLNNTIPGRTVKQRSKDKCGLGQKSIYMLSNSSDYYLKKTDILPTVLNSKAKLAQNTFLELIKNEENNINELVIDLTNLTIAQKIDTYREVNNTQISTENKLDNRQIVKIALAEQLEYEQGDPDNSNKEPSNILALEGLSGLKNFILFAEQQISNDFDKKDLKVFRKYLSLMRQKTVELFKQKLITDFFGGVRIQNNKYSPNKDYFLGEENFFDDKGLYNDDLYDENSNNEGLYNKDSNLYKEDLYNKDEDLYAINNLYDDNNLYSKDFINDKMD